MKAILPTLKEKKRYLVYEVLSDTSIDKDVSEEIVKKVKGLLGIFDSATAGIQAVQYDNKTQRGVLRVAIKGVDKVKMSLALINQLNEGEVTMRTIGASCILKKAKNKYIAS